MISPQFLRNLSLLVIADPQIDNVTSRGMVRLQHCFIKLLQFVGVEMNFVLVMLENTIVPSVHKLIVAILPENIASEMDGVGNLCFTFCIIDNIGRATTNVHHGN